LSKTQPLPDSTFLTIINASPIGMLLANKKGIITFSNPQAESIFGYTHSEFKEITVNQLVPDKLRKLHEQMRSDFNHSPTPRAMAYGRTLPAVTRNGVEIQVQLGLTPLKTDNEDAVLISIIDISNQILKVASYHDALTGLANRNLFKELASNLQSLSIRNKTSLSLLFLDLDGFKKVNDQSGHATGDRVLCQVASILTQSIRKNDIASRIGGDEFVLCFYDIKDIEHLQTLARNLIKQVTSIRKVDGHNVKIGASIGAIMAPNPLNMSIEDMIKSADRLMYSAKKAGKGQAISELQ